MHVQPLGQILQALSEARLWDHPWKSYMGFQELKYLSFLVGQGQLRPICNKVVILEQRPLPTNGK